MSGPRRFETELGGLMLAHLDARPELDPRVAEDVRARVAAFEDAVADWLVDGTGTVPAVLGAWVRARAAWDVLSGATGA